MNAKAIMIPLLLTVLCIPVANAQTHDIKNIGAIEYDSIHDDPNFKICFDYETGIPQYYEAGTFYKGGLKNIKNYFSEKFTPAIDSSQNGYLTIRFVVNCHGRTGWYRVLETDLDFNRFEFNPALKSNLLTLTKTLDQWQPGVYRNKTCDSYKFLTFKIQNGKIEDILP